MSDEPLVLDVLGSATPYPKPDHACSGYLVSHGETRLWMDAGSGTLAELQRYTRLDQLDAIWISHLHADHTADLLTAYYAVLYSDLRLPSAIPLFGPPGIAERLASFLTNTSVRSPIESAFEIHELQDRHETSVAGLVLRSRMVEHGMPAFAVRIEADGISLVYSGDTSPCANLTSLAHDSDVLLCEAESATAPTDSDLVHHTPEDTGNTADAANTRRLIVTHVGPFLTPEQAVTRAASRYHGPIEYAAPHSRFSIG